ncbi:MAG: hypothetical protein ACT4P4_29155 [Betaproteobacteria bacterium]
MPVIPTRARAFQAYGVILKFPAHSWSGVRDDGTVVFAIPADEVRADRHGRCYLLWAPSRRGAACTADRASRDERLEHCRLALRRGRGEGFLLHDGHATVETALLELRILLAGEKYWARWDAEAMPVGRDSGREMQAA